jgi:hypothetical protein
MSSATQTAANQANARLSTGPITEKGKAASSLNSRSHGFRSQTVLLPGDDPAEYEAILADLTDYFAPQELIETRFVREMADADFRLRRVRAHLESAIARHMTKLSLVNPGLSAFELQSVAISTLSETGTSYGTWLRYETKFERQYDRAFKDWTRYQELRRNAVAKETDLAMKQALFAPLPNQFPDEEHQPETTKSASNVQNSPQRATESASNVQNSPQHVTESASNVQIPRNAACPCGSREKFKRCCGRSALPVLGNGLAKAA